MTPNILKSQVLKQLNELLKEYNKYYDRSLKSYEKFSDLNRDSLQQLYIGEKYAYLCCIHSLKKIIDQLTN